MNWQVKYAIANFDGQQGPTAGHVEGELIRIVVPNHPEVLAAISAEHEITDAVAANYTAVYPNLDFLCGYRTTCVWQGEAIQDLEQAGIGWGSFGTLTSAALDGDANNASHKTYRFSDRLLRQSGQVQQVVREYDRVHRVALRSGTSVRIGMISDYEPTADAVRTFWDRFGAVDICWNINPNGKPSPEAIDAGRQLGCEVMKWNDLKEFLKTA